VTTLQDPPGLPAECPECRQRNEHRYQKRRVAKGPIEAAAPPGDKPAFIAATPDHICAQQCQEQQQHPEKFSPKPRRTGNLWKGRACGFIEARDPT
jgi:hypothetical protein